jgi:ubiquinone/menaquinone biosynthesis C-methylase UbiE
VRWYSRVVGGGIAQGFRHVDAHDDAARFASYLDAVSSLISAQKRATIELLGLQPGDAVLDVGCGTGDDVRLLAEVVAPGGRAVGLELSEALLVEARARADENTAIEFIAADAHAMPFGADEFEAVRVERGLQHMADPVAVLAEMVRVVRPGGRVVAIEPDWYTMVISGEDIETTRSVVREIAAHTRNSTAGRLLPAWYAAAGLVLDRLEATTIPVRSFRIAEQVMHIGEAIDRLDTPAVHAWRDDLCRQDAEGTFFAAMTGFIAAGATAL